jgi:hypothetical protein
MGNEQSTDLPGEASSSSSPPKKPDTLTTLLGNASAQEQQEEEDLIAIVLQAGCRQVILTLQAFLDNRRFSTTALAKLFDALSEYADDFRSSGHHTSPENDFVRLGVGRVFTSLMRLVAGDGGNDGTALATSVLTSPECVELLSTAMRAISSISKIPGQAVPLLYDGVLSATANILYMFSKLRPRKSERVVWWTINALFYLIHHGEHQALLLAMKDEALIQSLQTLANSPWDVNKRLAVHVSLVASKLAAGFHAESVALQKNLLV